MAAKSNPARVLRAAATAAFLASLALPCVNAIYRPAGGSVEYVVWGWEIAAFGALGAVEGIFAWYANPLLLLSLCLTRTKPVAALLLAATGLGLACSGLLVESVWNEPQPDLIRGFAIGGYIWLASFALAIAAALTALRSPRTPSSGPV